MNKKALIIVAILIAAISTTLIWQNLKKEISITSELIFEISKGENDANIFYRLSKEGIVKYPNIHEFSFKVAKKINSKVFFKSGEYQLNPGDSYGSVLKKFLSGEIYLRRITVVEGQTINEVVKELRKNEYLTGDIAVIPMEGSVLPETYFFKKGDSRKKQLAIMQNDLQEILSEAWNNRNKKLPIKNQQELLILASIVEKETGVNSERDHIAGVFVNRIRKRMRLQSDPTVIYTITKGKYKLERPLSKKDLRTVSPYNTYTTSGLPPTPIANAGKAAIFASANPLKTEDLYFVSDGTGNHRFSKTLVEHNKNVQLLRKYERSKK